jgi:hypothetical protein
VRIRTQCRDCGLPFRAELRPDTLTLPCPNCGHARTVATTGWSDIPNATVDVCPLCDCRHLYPQRDFNRALGCTLVAIGAALVPWTFGLSLLAFGLVDLWLYRRLKEVVVCYRCDTVYRDARPLPRQTEFDLLKHDVLKYGKSWDDEKAGKTDEAVEVVDEEGDGTSPPPASSSV